MGPALACEDLEKDFGDRPALARVAFAIEEGEHLAVTGPSGSGKTTLLRLLAGLIEPTRGRVLENGLVVNASDGRVSPHRRGIGMVFQGLGLWPHLTVREHIDFAAALPAATRQERRRRADEALAGTGLCALSARYPSELSGGEKQRVAFARAIAGAPRLLLLDEPLTSLDPALREDLLGLIESQGKAPGRTLVIVTHDDPVARRVARRVLTLIHASAQGTPETPVFPGEALCNPREP